MTNQYRRALPVRIGNLSPCSRTIREESPTRQWSFRCHAFSNALEMGKLTAFVAQTTGVSSTDPTLTSGARASEEFISERPEAVHTIRARVARSHAVGRPRCVFPNESPFRKFSRNFLLISERRRVARRTRGAADRPHRGRGGRREHPGPEKGASHRASTGQHVQNHEAMVSEVACRLVVTPGVIAFNLVTCLVSRSRVPRSLASS